MMSFTEAAISLILISSEYRLILIEIASKIGAFALLILSSAVENGLSSNCTCGYLRIGR